MIAKKYKLKSAELLMVLKRGRSLENEFFKFKYDFGDSKDKKSSVIVKNSISKNAVGRNRLKRMVYEVIRLNLNNFKPSIRLIIFPQKESTNKKFLELKSALEQLFGSIY